MTLAAYRDITTIRAGVVGHPVDLLVLQTTRTFRVDGEVAAVSVCSPGGETVHVLGFLLTEGLLAPGDRPLSIETDGDEVSVHLPHPALPQAPDAVSSDLSIPLAAVLEMAALSIGLAPMHRATGGTHSACVFRGGSPAGQSEDISRGAAFEKAVGSAMEAGVRFEDTILCLSSRVPEGFVLKAARAGIPMIAAVSAPTLQAACEAERLGICLCGFVRGTGANIYSCPWRVGL